MEKTFYFSRHSHSFNNEIKNYFKKHSDPVITLYGLISTVIFSQLKSSKKLFNSNYVCVSVLRRTWITAILLYLSNVKKTLNLLVCPYLKEKDIRWFVGYNMAKYFDIGNFKVSISKQIKSIVYTIIIILSIKKNFNLGNSNIYHKFINKQIKIYFNDDKYYIIKINKNNILTYSIIKNIKQNIKKYNYILYQKNNDIENSIKELLYSKDHNLKYLNKQIKENLLKYKKETIFKNLKNYKNISIINKRITNNYDVFNYYTEYKEYMYNFYEYQKNLNYFMFWLYKLHLMNYQINNDKFTLFKELFKENRIHCVIHNNIMKELLNYISNNNIGYLEHNNWTISLKINYNNQNSISYKKLFIRPGIPKL